MLQIFLSKIASDIIISISTNNFLFYEENGKKQGEKSSTYKNISSICHDPYDIMYLSVLNINALLDEIYILRLLECYSLYNSTSYNKYICNKQ